MLLFLVVYQQRQVGGRLVLRRTSVARCLLLMAALGHQIDFTKAQLEMAKHPTPGNLKAIEALKNNEPEEIPLPEEEPF